ncbi:MAG: hypothetical protein QW815_00380 [Nitrososphaerota archaeon]
MEYEKWILNVLFTDGGGDDIYVTVSFAPFFPPRHKCLLMGYCDHTRKIEIAPKETPYTLHGELYSSLAKEQGIIKEKCKEVFSRVVTNIKRELKTTMENIFSQSFPGYTVKFEYHKDPNATFIPAATYEGDEVIFNHIRLHHYEFAHHTPLKVEAEIRFTSATKHPLEVKSYEEIGEKMSELIQFYGEKIYPPTIRLVEKGVTKATSLLRIFLMSLKNDWKIEDVGRGGSSPYLSYRCVFSDPTAPKMNSIIYIRELSFRIPRHIGETLRENWEKSKGDWLEMINAVRFMVAFGKDYKVDEVEELLTFLDDLENYIKEKEK